MKMLKRGLCAIAAAGAMGLCGANSASAQTAPADSLRLIVNTTTGNVRLVGNDADPGETTGYSIESTLGSLNPAGFTSLADQGQAFQELPSSDTAVGENASAAAVPIGATGFSLGQLFDVGGAQDLRFTFLDEDFLPSSPDVIYVVPEPTSVALLGMGIAGLALRRRRNA